MRLLVRSVWCTLLIGAFAGLALAQPAPQAVPHGLMRFRSFGTAEGLDNLVIVSITQDPRGDIWVATDDGAYRYDGERFTHFSLEHGLVATTLGVVGRDLDGEPCVGSAKGMVCWNGTAFTRAGTEGLPAEPVHAIASAGDAMWVGTSTGLYVRARGRPFVAAPGWQMGGLVTAMSVDARGIVAARGGSVMASSGDGRWSELAIGLGGDRIDHVLRDRSGVLWIRSALHLWRLAVGSARAVDLGRAVPTSYDAVGATTAMVDDAHGALWIATDQGIATYDHERWNVIDRGAGFPSPSARTLFVDREGTMWIGGVGLFRWTGHGLIERHDPTTGLPGAVVWSAHRDPEGALWVGTNRCLARVVAGAWQCLPGSEGRVVRTFAFAPQGGVFLGGAPSDLLYIAPDGAVTSIAVIPHPGDHAIYALVLAGGDLWIATKLGLFRLPGAVPGAVERVVIPHVPADARFATLFVRDDQIWTATEAGLVVRDHTGWHLVDTGGALHAEGLRYVVPTHDGGLCAAYAESFGVVCFSSDGTRVSAVRHITAAEGLGSAIVYFLGEDRWHRLWIGTGNGVFVATERGIEHFTERDGLAGDDSAGMAFFADLDGSVWLGSTGGASHVDAARYGEPPRPPATRIIDGRLGDHAIHGEAPITTEHDRSALTVSFGAQTLIDPERIEYQVRLAPLERDWSSTHAREARYPALVPGDYRFEVRSRIDRDAWGPTAAVSFVVRPAWWQTRWFFALVCAAGLALVGGALTWRNRAAMRRRTRQLEQQSNARLRAVLEALPDLISVHRDNALIYLNPAACALFGIAPDASPLPDVREWIHPADRGDARALMKRAAARGEARELDILELRLRSRDGEWLVHEVSAVQIELGGAPVVVATGRDVTERNRLRGKLLLSDRMASLGTLAAGVAHEINNPLAYVMTNLELLGEAIGARADLDDDLREAVADATDGAERVRKIVKGLSTFGRPQQDQRRPIDIAGVLGSAIRLTANEVRHRAELATELGPVPEVVADDSRLTQVFINLIMNAAQAIPEGKAGANRIAIRTSTDAQGRAVIEVADTGRGMAPDVLARVFDPFFTTKDVGAGTGLGLSICHSIVTSFGGQIAIESAIGHGSTVRVVLPAASGAIAEPVPATTTAHAVTAQRRHVLVVDDEPRVAETTARILARDHIVTIALCGKDALDRIAQGAWFDVIVSDVMMPNMTGIELLEELVRIAPAQAARLVFLTGGAFTEKAQARLGELGTLVLDKPIGASELRRRVAEVAASAPPIAG